MEEQGGTDYVTLTVLGSQVLTRPDGLVAIKLVTQQRGAIAFLVDLTAIDILRKNLALAETLLHQKTGNA